MIKEPYKPVTDPTARLIQIRKTPKAGSKGDLVQLTVSQPIQEFFVQLMNHIGSRSYWFATCITCEHWKEQQCSKFKCVPPAAVIADGCEYYEDNDPIPF